MRTKPVEIFKTGLITSLEAKTIPRGSASSMENWRTMGDKIELSRGREIVGSENTGGGRVVGLYSADRQDGTAVVWRVLNNGNFEYYDSSTETWIRVQDENGSDISLTAGSECSFTDYSTNAGSFVYMSNPKDGIYKIHTANPGTAINLYDSTKNYKGYIKIHDNAMYLWGREADQTGLYRSHIDEQNWTTVSGEVIDTGDGTTKVFTGTLANDQVFGISITDSVEVFTDDYNGVLTGDKGGTGTINYITGAYSITFNTAPANSQSITADYQHEDPKNGGVLDFTYSGTRLAGEGNILRQDIGNDPIKNIGTYDESIYSLKEKRTYRVQYSTDDLTATNRVFREKAGINNWRALVETGEGIYYLDNSSEGELRVKLLTINKQNTKVEPRTISYNLDLSGYVDDQAVGFEFGDMVIFSIRSSSSSYNDTLIVYNRIWKSWDLYKFPVSCLTVKGGELWCGDSISNNVFVLFSGTDDDGFEIDNHYITNQDNCDTSRLKKTKRMKFEGEIGPDQDIKVYAAYDDDNFELIGTIDGGGSYVDTGQAVNVGAVTLGTKEIGGGTNGDIVAYHYFVEMRITSSPKFNKRKLKFVATGIGYASISLYDDADILLFGNKIPAKYR